MDADQPPRLHQEKFERLKYLREQLNWDVEEERYEFLRQVDPLIHDWPVELPNLREIFKAREIERLLSDCMTYWRVVNFDYVKLGRFIAFVAGSGYKNDPELDEAGKPLLRRTTALHLAARSCFIGRGEVVDNLFKVYDRFDANYVDDLGYTHFHAACEFKRAEVVKKYLELGQDPNCLVTKTGESPLHLVLVDYTGNRELVIELLLESGANPNLADKEGRTPLHSAAIDAHIGEVKMLLAFSSAVDAQNMRGETPLHLALRGKRQSMAKLLLRCGANPNLADEQGSTALHVVAKKRRRADVLANAIFEASLVPVQIDARDKLGRTPLHVALQASHNELIECLLRRDADKNWSDAEARTLLHSISRRKNEDDNDGFLAKTFFKIKEKNKVQVRVDAPDELGNTPLQLAVANLKPHLVDVLLNHGADLSSFVFPDEALFDRFYKLHRITRMKMRTAVVLDVLEHLEKQGYQPDRDVALAIMKLFAKYKMFGKSSELDRRCFDDEQFVEKAKDQQVEPGLSLYDLIQLRPREIARQLTLTRYDDMFASQRSLAWKMMSLEAFEACATHLRETLSRRFFKRWATDCLWELIHLRLPILCCDMIVENLTNEDLYNICLAATSQSREDDKKRCKLCNETRGG